LLVTHWQGLITGKSRRQSDTDGIIEALTEWITLPAPTP
jgi:hypothetical protein